MERSCTGAAFTNSAGFGGNRYNIVTFFTETHDSGCVLWPLFNFSGFRRHLRFCRQKEKLASLCSSTFICKPADHNYRVSYWPGVTLLMKRERDSPIQHHAKVPKATSLHELNHFFESAL